MARFIRYRSQGLTRFCWLRIGRWEFLLPRWLVRLLGL